MKPTPNEKDIFDGVIISDEHTIPEKTEYICSWCNQSLVRLSDKNNQSESWFCRNCSIAFDSEDEKIRHKQRLSIPYQESEPAAVSIGFTPDVSIHHTPPIRGGLAELQKKSIRIKDYHTTEKE